MSPTAAKRVLFFVPFGSYLVHNQLDAIVATALRVRGAEILVARCDGIFRTCDLLAWTNEPAKSCAECSSTGELFFETFKLPCAQLRAFLSDTDFAEAQRWADSLSPEQYSSARYGDAAIGDWSTSSLFSYFRMTEAALLEPNMRPKSVPVHKGFLITGLLTYLSVSRLLDQFRPTHLFCFNARFAPYRVAFETARKRGIPVVTHERGTADDSFLLFENYGSIQTQPVYDAYDVWRDEPLDDQERARVKTYLANREVGIDTNIAPFVDYATEYAKVRNFLRLPHDAKLVGVFTSSEYELSWTEDFKTFTSQLGLIEKLVEVFRHRSEYLIVRHHPYLGGDPSSLADHGFMRRAHEVVKNAPQNVRFIMPSERLSSYALFWNLDASIGLLSTTGIESSARMVANASFKQSLFRDVADAIIESDDPKYLHSLVDNLLAKTANYSANDLRRIYRFVNVFMNKLSVRFKTFGIKNFYEHDLRLDHFPLIGTGGDPSLDRLCDYVLQGKPFLEQPKNKRDQTSQAKEMQFFETEAKEIAARRTSVKEQSRVHARREPGPSVDILVANDGIGPQKPPGQLERSRHREFQVRSVVTKTPNAPECVEVLGKGTSEFVVLTHSRVEYDESFLSLGVDQLTMPEHGGKKGIIFGAWLRDERGIIYDQVLSKRSPCRDNRDLFGRYAFVEEPFTLFSLTIVRRAVLLSFLKDHRALATGELNRTFHRWTQSADWIQIHTHGALLYNAAAH